MIAGRSPGPQVGEEHRNVTGGAARAAVFGVSDGLVTNASLVLGVVGADVEPSFVRLAGVAGLLAGAFSMAVGEYVSMRAQAELVERELQRERDEIENHPRSERRELSQIYVRRGVRPAVAETMARELMRTEASALESHAREELGVDPAALGSPVAASASSFLSFSVGAFVPLVPWLLSSGVVATVLSFVLSAVAALAIGAGLAWFTGRSRLYSAGRQLALAAAAAGATYLVGSLIGVSTS